MRIQTQDHVYKHIPAYNLHFFYCLFFREKFSENKYHITTLNKYVSADTALILNWNIIKMNTIRYHGNSHRIHHGADLKHLHGKPVACIIGAGSIGQLTADFLRRSGRFRTCFIDTRINKKKKVACSSSIYQQSSVYRCSRGVYPANYVKYADLIIITVKAFSVSKIIRDIEQHLSFDTPVILMVNGFGAQEELKKLTRENRLYLASTSNGATHNGFSVVRKGVGSTYIGPLKHAKQTKVIKYFIKSLPNGSYTDDIYIELLRKLAVNAVINPFTALNNCLNGEILKQPQIIQEILKEITPILNRLGLTDSQQMLFQRVETVASNTKSNYSSMRQDYYYGRLSEIDYILGILIKKARIYGIKTPYIDSIYQKLKQM